MENLNKTNKFLANLTTILSKEATELIYLTHGVKFERCNLYSDFVQSLILLVFDTYLGDDITTQEDRLQHFKWCWYTNIENFKKENINFKDTIDLYDYFLVFLFEVYYLTPNKKTTPKLHENISKMWLKLFDINILKTRSDTDNFLEVYDLFEDSLNKG